jgi:hypothetical protein
VEKPNAAHAFPCEVSCRASKRRDATIPTAAQRAPDIVHELKARGVALKATEQPVDREFNHAYEGTKSAVEDMHLEYQACCKQTPGSTPV